MWTQTSELAWARVLPLSPVPAVLESPLSLTLVWLLPLVLPSPQAVALTALLAKQASRLASALM